jgi:hypothetical protein
MFRKVMMMMAMLMVLAQVAAAVPPAPGEPGGYRTENGYDFTLDYYEDNLDSYGDAAILSENAQAPFEIWEVGSKVVGGQLKFSIWQDLPAGGAPFSDGYQDNANISPGDLWITIGSCNPFDANATRYALALTDRTLNVDYDAAYGGNIVRQKYPNEIWPEVTQGALYRDAVAATGTFEEYQQHMTDQGHWYWMDDQDGDDTTNSYMSLIKGYEEELLGVSSVQWTEEGYEYWDYGIGDWAWYSAWRITGSISLDALGLGPGDTYSLFLSMECGNDGAKHCDEVPIPEPGSLMLMLGGLAVAAVRRRRT